ncbi:MAG: polysaccharide biosynthesis/export family protein [Nitrospira sp.]|nr:polysaccharide biosynthesis/export family protein [Nitrospira sp.]
MSNKVWHVVAAMGVVALSLFSAGCLKPDVMVSPGQPEEGFFLGPEDVIDVVVWKNPDLSKEVVIRPDGKISLPLIGDIPAQGRTADQLAKDLAERFKAFKENPSVSVNVVSVNSYFVFMVGEVNKPGKLQLKSYTTILQALSLAEGFTQFASRNDLRVVRSMVDENGKMKELRIPLRYDDLISEEGGVYNITLKTGDTVIVP